MTECRSVAQTADGATVVRPGRRYRLLLLVQGPTDTKTLIACLASCGFGSIGVSLPDDWSKHRPKDWPDEGMYALMDGQCLIRASAEVHRRGPVRVECDNDIEPGAVMRLIETWDCGEAESPVTRTGAVELDKASRGEDKGRKFVIGAAAVAAVALGWNWLSGRRKLEKEQERFERMQHSAEEDEIKRRVHELAAGGMDRTEAFVRAKDEADGLGERGEDERDPRVIVIRA
jgi:hypothetical protein